MNFITHVERVGGKVRRVEATYEGVTLAFSIGKDGLPVQVSRRGLFHDTDFVFPAGVYSEIVLQVYGVVIGKRKDVQLSLGV